MIYMLQYVVCIGDYNLYKKYVKLVQGENDQLLMICFMLKLKLVGLVVLLEEVEFVESIMCCFKIGVMFFGFISKEVYEDLVIVMNCVGGKLNIGEGGEDLVCFIKDSNGDLWCSVIKQVVFGCFGVMFNYFVNVDEIQIKMV